MTDWNYGDILETVEDAIDPARLAFAHGERTISWGEAAQRGNRLARAFLAAGLTTGDKVAHYMRNSPAYMETTRACFKARLTPVNVNYRYRPDEVAYIVENSDAAAVVYDAVFRDTIAEIRPRLPGVKLFLEVGGGAEDVASLEERHADAVLGEVVRVDPARLAGFVQVGPEDPEVVAVPGDEPREVVRVRARAGVVGEDVELEVVEDSGNRDTVLVGFNFGH